MDLRALPPRAEPRDPTCRETATIDGGIVTAIKTGVARGPRIIPYGPALIQMGGHADFHPSWVQDPCQYPMGVPGLAMLSHVVSGPAQLRAAARLAFKRGAKFLNLCLTGEVTSPTDSLDDLQPPIEEIRAAVEEAHARHTSVTVHTHNKTGIPRGLEAGVECFEHPPAPTKRPPPPSPPQEPP